MSSYDTDEEQLEAIRKWWAENGRAVILGVVLGLGAIFGWRGWVSHEQGRAEAASTIYEQMMSALEGADVQTVRELSERLGSEYDDTPYAELSALARARVEVNAGDLEAAANSLRWAADNASQPDVALVARLRLARVQYAQGRLDEALATLGSGFPGSYGAMVEELRGDILAEKGDAGAARSAYRKALEDPSAAVDRGVLEMKLNELGSTEPPGSTS